MKKIIVGSIGVVIIVFLIIGIVVFVTRNNNNQDENNQKNDSEETITEEKDKLEETIEENQSNNSSFENNTGGLSAYANEYEGIEGTGKYNYGEALQKSLLFYELQRSGDLPEVTRCNWRGDSAMADGSDVGLDLTGGWYDAGDHVKFNLPMSYSATMLAWSVYEDKDSYEASGQLEYIMEDIRWANDYFIKCHPEDEVYYYQVGDGGLDHGWWGPAEAMTMNRPAYKVTKDAPGSTVVAESAASLAACSIVFADTDEAYSKRCLEHAIALYDFAESTKSDVGYTAANGFYNSWSGFNDELSWAATWLYMATKDEKYLEKADKYFDLSVGNYKWAQCWDDVYVGSALLLTQITDEDKYKSKVEKNLDYWTTGVDGEQITYTPKGLAWLDQWGSLRYATTQAFIGATYSEYKGCSKEKQKIYMDFAVNQVNYALGSSGRSYVVGFGENSPSHPHHRTSQGSWTNSIQDPVDPRHILFGALVGGPDSSDGYTDEVGNYVNNEVACDYNAGYTCALAKLYGTYHGKTLVNFGAVENVGDELYIEAGINASGADFIEIKGVVYNKSSWPARITDNLTLAYFFDLSEVIEGGGSASDIQITTNYMQGGQVGEVKQWKDNIYYVTIDFSGEKICPGGQDSYKREVQFRIASSKGVWNNENDPSYQGLAGSGGGNLVDGENLALYEGDLLVYGKTPDGNGQMDTSSEEPTQTNTDNSDAASTKEDVAEDNSTQENTAQTTSTQGLVTDSKLTIVNDGVSSPGSIALSVLITNNQEEIKLKDLEVRYYFTKDTKVEDIFSCDHSAISNLSGKYTTLSEVKGEFVTMKKSVDKADTYLSITCKTGSLLKDDSWKIQGRINKFDWTNYDLTNDYSGSSEGNVVILYKGKVISGNIPK